MIKIISFCLSMLEINNKTYNQMKILQNSSTKIKRTHTPNNTLFKYNCPLNTKLQSPTKHPKTTTQYNDFIQGFTTQQPNAIRPVSEILTEKQFSKMNLFESVKKAKGEFYFKTIYQKSKYMQIKPSTDLSEEMPQRKHFIYIVSGHFNIYKYTESQNRILSTSQDIKNSKQSNRQLNLGKCYIRSYGAHQHFGYQEYPLYWKQKLIIEASVDSTVILFPLDTFYKVFSNVINLAPIQLTAEFFKKISVFKEVEMQKLLRISTFSQRIRTYPNTLIAQKGQKIDKIILLYDGRISLLDQNKFYSEETTGILIGKKQIDLKKQFYDYQIRALIQCDLIVIPLVQFSKISQIKHKLKDSTFQDQERNIKSRKKMYSNLNAYEKQIKYSVTGYQTLEEQMYGKGMSTDSIKQKKSISLMLIDDQNDSSLKNEINSTKTIKYRPKTASQAVSMSRTDQKSIIYGENGRQFYYSKVKMSMNQRPNSNFFQKSQRDTKSQEKESLLQNVTMGEIYWAKFLNRKSELENKEIAKIINARLPESILNESKEYAVMKPMVQKKSTYIKNYKRKIKHSHKINEVSKLNTSGSVTRVKINLKVEPPPNRVCMSSFMINSDDL